MALARKRFPDHTVFYCPLDFTWAVAEAMRRVRPDVLVLSELELWPNLIRAARNHGARVAVINGRLSESSFQGYRRVRRLLRPVVDRLDLVAAQDATYAERFRAIGVPDDRIDVTGSMKFDGAQTDRDNAKTRELAAVAGFGPADVVFLAGSTQEPEERIVLDVFRRLSAHYPRLRLIIVPRHPERFDEVARLIKRSGIKDYRRRSTIGGGPHADHSSPNSRRSTIGGDNSGASVAARCLLVDTVGELGAWWGTARIAFVGGSLGSRGGQNMIEPAAYGAAVSFGPNTRNFRDIVAALLRRDAAVVVDNAERLEEFVRRCLTEPDWADALGRRARELVVEQQGATRRTVDLLAGLVDGAPVDPPRFSPDGVARRGDTLRSPRASEHR
jgi:3-deoxy-D-manno-octulosonic-acid transferase